MKYYDQVRFMVFDFHNIYDGDLTKTKFLPAKGIYLEKLMEKFQYFMIDSLPLDGGVFPQIHEGKISSG